MSLATALDPARGRGTDRQRASSKQRRLQLFPAGVAGIETPSAEDPERLFRQDMLLSHLPQVQLVARGVWTRLRFAVDLDDLIGYGIIGLLRAIERFDPSRGILLKTYAEHRIRGAILDGLRGMDWLPRSARQRERRRQENIHQETADSPAGSPSQPDPGNPRGPSCLRHGAQRMTSVFPGGSLEDLQKLAEATQGSRGQLESHADPEFLYERKERQDRLAAAVAQLPARQRQILALYYRRELSMKQIGTVMRVHESRVSQLHAAAIARLRKQLGSMNEPIECSARKPPQRYAVRPAEREARSRAACSKSASVSTPTVS